MRGDELDTPVSGTPRLLVRVEGLLVLLGAVSGYLAGYLAGPRTGASVYNSAHTYIAPAGLAALTYLGVTKWAWPVCLIWAAHIGMDRALGFGLKFPSAFQDTHLGRVGRAEGSA